MDILKTINKYNQLILGITYVVIIGIAAYNHEGLEEIISSPIAVSSILALTLFTLISFLRYCFPFKYTKPSKIKSEISENISKDSTPFVIRIINEEFIYSNELKEKIIESDIWDWTIFGRHIDNPTSYITRNLRKNFQKSYFKFANKINTSSLIFFKDYPFGRKCFYITGNIVASPKFFKPKNFQEFPMETESSYSFSLVFNAYYEFESHLVGENKIKKCKSTHDAKLIQKKWEEISDKIILNKNNATTLCWKNKTPEKDDIQNFIKIIDSSVIDGNIDLYSNKNLMYIIKEMQKNLNAFDFTLFFAGYLLSPISFYNDLIVNIPISVFLATQTITIFNNLLLNKPILIAIYYIITNAIGLLLMYVSLRNINTKISWTFMNKKSFISIGIISIALVIVSYLIEYILFK